MAIEDPEERANDLTVEWMVPTKLQSSECGSRRRIDVIDPAETRSWIAESLKRVPPKPHRTEKISVH